MFRFDEFQLAIMSDAEKARALADEFVCAADLKNPARMKYLCALGLKRAEPQKVKRGWGALSDPVKEARKRARLALKATFATRDEKRKKAEAPPEWDKEGNSVGGWTVRFVNSELFIWELAQMC